MDPVNDTPSTSWRAKMAHAELVDSGITFQGGKGYGGNSTAWPQKRLIGNAIHFTRPKFRTLIKDLPVGNRNIWSNNPVYGK